MNLIAEMKPSRFDRFHALAWPHFEACLRTARCITHGNDSEAEDLTQETMVKAFRRIDALRDHERAQPWLRMIMRNTHIDRTRVHRRPEVSLHELEYDLPARTNPAEDKSSALDTEAVTVDPDEILNEFADEDVLAAVRKLPRDIRWTILLVDVKSMQEAEAAQTLGVPVGTIKSRLHRGRKMLRESLHAVAREMRMAS